MDRPRPHPPSLPHSPAALSSPPPRSRSTQPSSTASTRSSSPASTSTPPTPATASRSSSRRFEGDKRQLQVEDSDDHRIPLRDSPLRRSETPRRAPDFPPPRL